MLGPMCGRYAASRTTDELVEQLEIEADHTAPPTSGAGGAEGAPPRWVPQYNVTPSQEVPVALTRVPRGRADGGEGEGGAADPATDGTAPVRQLRLLRWGLVPSWAKDPKVGMRMTNARAETLLTKPAFRRAARSRRCLVPADGWYEWQTSPVATDAKGKPRKQPFYMRRGDGAGLAFAGLYEFFKDPGAAEGDDPWLVTFAIVTGPAEPGLDRIHDRQPVVLDPDRWAAWLDPAEQDPDVVAGLLRPDRPGRFEAHPVGRAVGNSRSEGPHLVEPVGMQELEGVVDPATGEILGA